MSNDTTDNTIERIKATISLYDYNLLKKDLEQFDIGTITTLCNRLISYYRGKEIIEITKEVSKTNSKTLNIRIQKHHMDFIHEDIKNFKEKISYAIYLKDLIYNYLNNSPIDQEKILNEEKFEFINCIYTDIKDFHNKDKKISYANYLRYLIYNYLNNSPIDREKILNEEKFKFIRRVIKEKKILQKNISSTKILPIAIIKYEPEGRSYLLNFYIKEKKFRCLQIKNFIIKDYTEIDEQMTLPLEKRNSANNLQKNFDPFLTFGRKVKVKFTENGKTSYEKTVHNKPKLDKIDENGNYTFQCTEFLGKLYFGQFLDDVEILEPESLRTYFKEKSQKMYNLYNKKNKE